MFDINQNSSAAVDFDILDGLTPVPAADIYSVTATLYDVNTKQIINGRLNQDVKNNNGGTLTDGHMFFSYLRADGAIFNDQLDYEDHVLVFSVSWNGGTLGFEYEIVFHVKHLPIVAMP